ncbi:MAG: hypothetical protein J2P57_15455 [Acidimicrobiaceae bacterium]|nr:hypothetical protein [Acidimicrobiaceae bacterium]
MRWTQGSGRAPLSDDDGWPDDAYEPQPRGVPASERDGALPPGRRARSALILGAVALAMIGTVAMLALVASNILPPDETVAPGSPPTPWALGQGGGNAAAPGGIGAPTEALIAGRVAAVSRSSITIQGSGHALRGAVSSSTRVTGRATSIGAVEVGDEVSAQIAKQSGRMVVTAIQDPAARPSG